jgi:L-cysteine desulfidase
VAVALACAAAADGGSTVKSIDVAVSRNIYKNGASVGIPGIKETGIKAAAAIGSAGGDYRHGLQVLNNIDDQGLKKYHELMEDDKVNVSISDNGDNLYIEAKVTTDEGMGKCIIKGSHSNIVYLEKNGSILMDTCSGIASNVSHPLREKLIGQGLEYIIEVIDKTDLTDLEFLMEGADMNRKVAEYGFKERPGMAIGATILDSIKKGLLSDDLYHSVQAYTAAASDARMSGQFIPVMSSAGSGNNGLTAILPVTVAGEKLGADRDTVIKALAISHIVNIYIKNYTGRLSALCSCGVSASTGSAVAIAYIMGASFKQIEGVINNMIGDVAGMICDGAKPGCALKLSTAAGVAVKSAILALNGSVVPADNGIIGNTCEETIRNLGRVSMPGMLETDKIILETMIEKRSS